jgi:hypothetical protein
MTYYTLLIQSRAATDAFSILSFLQYVLAFVVDSLNGETGRTRRRVLREVSTVTRKVKKRLFITAAVLLSLFAAMLGAGLADLDDPYADEVISFTQGGVWDNTETEPPGTWGMTDDPDEALGGPTRGAGNGNAYFVSLGASPAGEIVLKFTDRVIIDGEENSGYDFVIHEFGAQDDAFVYLSNDRNGDGNPDGWKYLGYTATDATFAYEQGYHPDYITGQSSSCLFFFDVAGELDDIGGWADYIRIVDDDAGRSDPNFTDGFDLNAVEILNYGYLEEIDTGGDDEEQDQEQEQEEEQEQDSSGDSQWWYGKGCSGYSWDCGHDWDNCQGSHQDCGCGSNKYYRYTYTKVKPGGWWNFNFGRAWSNFWRWTGF